MHRTQRWAVPLVAVTLVIAVVLLVPVLATADTPGNVRLSNDAPGTGGYVSAYTLATGIPYTDAVLQEASIARGRQNEPAVEIDPRNPSVLIGSSNDYWRRVRGLDARQLRARPARSGWATTAPRTVARRSRARSSQGIRATRRPMPPSPSCARPRRATP